MGLNSALVALVEERPAAAIDRASDALRIGQRIGDRKGIVYCLLVAAAAEAQLGRWARATILLGAVELRLKDLSLDLEPFESDLRARTIEELSGKLHRDAFDAAHDFGRSMSAEQVMELVLRQDDRGHED